MVKRGKCENFNNRFYNIILDIIEESIRDLEDSIIGSYLECIIEI